MSNSSRSQEQLLDWVNRTDSDSDRLGQTRTGCRWVFPSRTDGFRRRLCWTAASCCAAVLGQTHIISSTRSSELLYLLTAVLTVPC
ncbi:uncharacterized [Tachysurus ichikawai]